MKTYLLASVLALGLSAPVWSQTTEPSQAPLPDINSGLTLSGPWRIGPRLAEARAGLSVAALEGRIYAAGGAGLVDPRDDLEVYDPGAGLWRALKPLPVGLERFAMTAAEGRLYIAGGYSGEQGAVPIDQVWSYDPEMDLWQGETALPGPKASFAMVALENALYALGGEDGAPGLFVFDLDTREWNAAEAPEVINRRGAAAVVIGSEIWLMGGVRDGQASARVDVYDTVSQSWREGPDLPEPRAGHAAAVVEGAIHIFGGRSADMRQTLSSHLSLEPQINAWVSEPDMPAARTEAGAASLENEVWLVGGGAGAGFFAPFTAVDAVDVFSPGSP